MQRSSAAKTYVIKCRSKRENREMKKKMITLLAATLLTSALAGNALAAYEDLNLVRIAYGTTNEVATDLGAVSSLLGTTQTLSSGASNFVTMGAGATGAGSSVWATYYAVDTANNTMYFSAQSGLGSIAVASSNGLNAISQLGYGINSFYSNLLLTTDSTATSATTTRATYAGFFTSFEQGTPGFGGFGSTVSASKNTEVSLTAAATQELYYWDGVSATATDTGTSITTNLDGSTTISSSTAPAATPIPPAFFLMGSGLLGMVGLRRKKN
jgi:hypothetical protein